MKNVVQHPITNSHSHRILSKKPEFKLRTSRFSRLFWVSTLLFSMAAFSGCATTSIVEKPRVAGKVQAGSDLSEGTITVEELTSLEKPQADIDIGNVDSSSSFKFSFNGHRITGVLNLCYVSNPGCNPSGVDVVLRINLDGLLFLDLDLAEERERYNQENPGNELTHFNFRIDTSGRDVVFHLIPNGEIKEGNFDLAIILNPDYETNGRTSRSYRTSRIILKEE